MAKIEAGFTKPDKLIKELLTTQNTRLADSCLVRTGKIPGIKCPLDIQNESPDKNNQPENSLSRKEKKAIDRERKAHPNRITIDWTAMDQEHEERMRQLLQPDSSKTCFECHFSTNCFAGIIRLNREFGESMGYSVYHPTNPIIKDDRQNGVRVIQAVFTKPIHSGSKTRLRTETVISQEVRTGYWAASSTSRTYLSEGKPGNTHSNIP